MYNTASPLYPAFFGPEPEKNRMALCGPLCNPQFPRRGRFLSKLQDNPDPAKAGCDHLHYMI